MRNWLLMILGLVLVGLAFPVPGVPGGLLAVGGVALLWTGYIRRMRGGRR